MLSLIMKLKSVVFVILLCEFLKELLVGEKFKQYIQFAVSLFLFTFFLSAFLHTDFSFVPLSELMVSYESENLLLQQYETQIETAVSEELSKNQCSFQTVSVTLSDSYEIKNIRIISEEDPNKIHSLLKGDVPYEVVHPTSEIPAQKSY